LCNVVRNAAKTAIAKAVTKITNAVRWVFIIDPPASPNHADRLATHFWSHHRLEARGGPSGNPSRRSNSCLLMA
jgi:hypothetical protein